MRSFIVPYIRLLARTVNSVPFGTEQWNGHCRIYSDTGFSMRICRFPPFISLSNVALIQPRRLRTGRSVQRMLTRGQVLYLRLEAEGVRLLPLVSRRAIAKQIESSPEIDAVVLREGSAVV